MAISTFKMSKMAGVNRSIEGEILNLPCQVRSAFFPDESFYHILVDGATNRHVIVGHVNSNSIIHQNGSKFVPALVMKSLEKETARIFLPGELVSDPNPASVPLAWLSRFVI